MKVICDSREKKNSHILAYFDRHGIEYEIHKLDVGDYMIDGNNSVSVDTKRSIDEVATNLLNRNDHARFWREVRRAKESGTHLVVLVESNKYRSIPELATWHSKYSGVSGKSVMNEMYRVHISYGVDFLFAPKISTARRIIKILTQNTLQSENSMLQ